jgi:hypothetical protein
MNCARRAGGRAPTALDVLHPTATHRPRSPTSDRTGPTGRATTCSPTASSSALKWSTTDDVHGGRSCSIESYTYRGLGHEQVARGLNPQESARDHRNRLGNAPCEAAANRGRSQHLLVPLGLKSYLVRNTRWFSFESSDLNASHSIRTLYLGLAHHIFAPPGGSSGCAVRWYEFEIDRALGLKREAPTGRPRTWRLSRA